jgi:predicted TIM-barrel fold metal-dependent hydrolase
MQEQQFMQNGPTRANRRQFLAGAAACAAAGAALPRFARAAAPPQRLIDIHHHFEPTGKNKDGDPWTIQMSLDQLDRNGVTAAIAYAGPIMATDPQAARKQARETNEWSTRQCVDHPGRFGLFASLPMNDVEGSLAEIAYALDVLKADGVGIATEYQQAWLGDPKFEPIFQELDRRRAAVYVHPAEAPCCTPATLTYEKPPLATAWMEFPVNTARTILSLWNAQTTRRLPGIRFIFCHGGGVMPILLGRFSGFNDWRAVGPEGMKKLFPDGVYAEFAKFYFDCAQAFAPESFALLRTVVPPTHLMFGTDFTYFPVAHSVELFARLSMLEELRKQIASANAGSLLPRWKA